MTAEKPIRGVDALVETSRGMTVVVRMKSEGQDTWCLKVATDMVSLALETLPGAAPAARFAAKPNTAGCTPLAEGETQMLRWAAEQTLPNVAKASLRVHKT